jgi:hypothetical protein
MDFALVCRHKSAKELVIPIITATLAICAATSPLVIFFRETANS